MKTHSHADIRTRLTELSAYCQHWFSWKPSDYFHRCIRQYVESVPTGYREDLISLVFCLVNEWLSWRGEGQLFHKAFRSQWGKSVDSKLYEGKQSEAELEKTFAQFLDNHPNKRHQRIDFSPADIILEDSVLRALDRERQRWRRAAARIVRTVNDQEPDTNSAHELSETLARVELAGEIRGFVQREFGEDGTTLFTARFEQSLSFDEIARIFAYSRSVDSLRQEAHRMREAIRSRFFGQIEHS